MEVTSLVLPDSLAYPGNVGQSDPRGSKDPRAVLEHRGLRQREPQVRLAHPVLLERLAQEALEAQARQEAEDRWVRAVQQALQDHLARVAHLDQ